MDLSPLNMKDNTRNDILVENTVEKVVLFDILGQMVQKSAFFR